MTSTTTLYPLPNASNSTGPITSAPHTLQNNYYTTSTGSSYSSITTASVFLNNVSLSRSESSGTYFVNVYFPSSEQGPLLLGSGDAASSTSNNQFSLSLQNSSNSRNYIPVTYNNSTYYINSSDLANSSYPVTFTVCAKNSEGIPVSISTQTPMSTAFSSANSTYLLFSSPSSFSTSNLLILYSYSPVTVGYVIAAFATVNYTQTVQFYANSASNVVTTGGSNYILFGQTQFASSKNNWLWSTRSVHSVTPLLWLLHNIY